MIRVGKNVLAKNGFQVHRGGRSRVSFSRRVLGALGILALGLARASAQSTVVATVSNQYAISTLAGGAPPATPVAATSASIGNPWEVATDAAGNVYFTGLGCVFKIDTSGVLTRIAGTSRLDYFGDGGPAINTPLSGPTRMLARWSSLPTAKPDYVAQH
jgi:hypothetical protein